MVVKLNTRHTHQKPPKSKPAPALNDPSAAFANNAAVDDADNDNGCDASDGDCDDAS